MNQMNVWGMTDIGLVRKDNQDAYATAQHEASGRTVCVVCDGMGGPAGGQVASRIAVDTYLEELEKVLTPDMTPEQLREASSYAVSLANRAIREEAQRRARSAETWAPPWSPPSPTTAGVVVTNVGDSRAYQITPGRHYPDHQGPLSGGEHGGPGGHHRGGGPPPSQPQSDYPGAGSGHQSAVCDGYICPMQAGRVSCCCAPTAWWTR